RELWGWAELRRIDGAYVGAFPGNHFASPAQARVQLPTPDVDRVNKPCTACNQNLGKPAGRSPNVETHLTGWIEMKVVERGNEFSSSTRDPMLLRRCIQHRVGEHFLGRLGYDEPIGGDPAGSNCGLRLGAAFKQAALDQQTINANAFGHERAKGKR